MARFRKAVSVGVALTVALAAGACGDDGGSSTTAASSGATSATSGASGGSSAGGTKTFAIITPSPINDKSFSELGYGGFTAGAKAAGAKTLYQENVEVSKAVEAFRNLAAQGAVAVIGLGGQFQDAAEQVAPEFPKVNFVVVNGNRAKGNVSYYSLAEGELAYLAGVAIAATKSPSKLGQVAGIEIAPIKAQGYGLTQGAQTVASKITFSSTFTGDMNDSAKAKEATIALFKQGADVVYTSLNEAIAGAEQGAKETGGLLFNNQANKCKDVPGVYYGYTSSAVDLAVSQVVRGIADGSLKPGFADSNLTNPAQATEIGLCSGPLPDAAKKLVDEAKKKLISGEIKIKIPGS